MINRNSDITKEIIEDLKLQVAQGDKVLSPIPVLEVNPKLVKNGIAKTNTSSSNGNTTIYTTPTDKDFYLTGFIFSMTKDALCDTATALLRATTNSQVTDIAALGGITLTAQDKIIAVNLQHPIKIDKNTSIVLNCGKTAGSILLTGTIFGFIDEVPTK